VPDRPARRPLQETPQARRSGRRRRIRAEFQVVGADPRSRRPIVAAGTAADGGRVADDRTRARQPSLRARLGDNRRLHAAPAQSTSSGSRERKPSHPMRRRERWDYLRRNHARIERRGRPARAACSRCRSALAHARSRICRVAYRGFQITGLGFTGASSRTQVNFDRYFENPETDEREQGEP
jgi:hypothetical protein